MNNPINNKNINDETVKYIARLSRLSLTDDEASKFQKQLSAILDYIDQLGEVNTEEVLPTTHAVSSMKNVFREDVPVDSLSQDDALRNAPEKEDGFFKVPKVI